MEVNSGYKQTEVGVIPEDWEVRTIGKVFRLINGRAFKPEDWKTSGTPIIRIQNLNDATAGFNYSRLPVAERNRVETGDLLFAWSGTLGTSFGARVWNGPSGVLNQHIFKVLMDEREITLPFSLLVFARVEEDIAKQTHGFKASFVHIKKSDLVKVRLPLPKPAEQRAIAATLNDVDGLLGGLDRLIAKKRDLKQAAMQQLLTGQTRLPGFQGEWDTRTLGSFVEIKKGEMITEANTVPGSIPVVAGGKQPAYYHNRANRSGKTVTISGSGASAGYVSFHRSPIFASDCSTISEGKSYSIEFVYFLLHSRQEEIYRAQTGGAQPHIHPNDLRPIVVSAPQHAEQSAIAEVLTEMDEELAVVGRRRDKTRDLKQAMIQALLTGRIRLVSATSNVVSLPQNQKRATAKSAHNWQINEAVIIGVLAGQFGTEKWPLPRKRQVKLTYLLHRHVEGKADGYLKKAAGPYNPKTKYRGPEGIALKNRYVRTHNNGTYVGFVAAEKIGQAERYFGDWYPQAKEWLEQFRFEKTDELELLATVDMATEDLRSLNRAVKLKAVKEVIRAHPEWEAKLSRAIFSDDNITRAINKCNDLFAS